MNFSKLHLWSNIPATKGSITIWSYEFSSPWHLRCLRFGATIRHLIKVIKNLGSIYRVFLKYTPNLADLKLKAGGFSYSQFYIFFI